MVAIDAFLFVYSAISAAIGFSFWFYPASHVLLGYNADLLTKFLASDFNAGVIVPMWAGAQIALASVTFYATTMTSLHDKAKVARGVLFALIGALLANLVDTYTAKQSVFSHPTTLQYTRIGAVLALTAWCLVECFSASEDDARPVKDSAKKNKHVSTPTTANNIYLRALSLLWLVQGCVTWFAPSHMGYLGLEHPHLSSSVFNGFSTTSIGGLLIALATIAGYGATFQSTHNQAKLARSFLLYEAILFGHCAWAVFKGGYGVNETTMWIHVALTGALTAWSLLVSFSATSDDIVAGSGGRQATVRKQH
jgi:hypothetical protein